MTGFSYDGGTSRDVACNVSLPKTDLLHKWEVKMKRKTRIVTLLSLFVLALLVFRPGGVGL